MAQLVSYRQSVQWIARNDDIDLYRSHIYLASGYPFSARLIAWQFNKDTDKVVQDVIAEYHNLGVKHE